MATYIGSTRGGTNFGDSDVSNVGDISLDSISSDSATSVSVVLGTDAGDDLIVATDALVVEGDNKRVGIGTTSPSVTLDVIGTISAALAEGSLSQGNIQVGVDSGGDPGGELMFHTDDYVGIRCANAGAPPLVVKPSGDVGVGTTAPAVALDVIGTGSFAGAAASLSQGNVQVGVDSGGDPGGELMFHTDDYVGLRCADSGTLPFIVKPSGNVGIGVTDPDVSLEVFDTATQLKLSYDASNACTFATGSGGDLTIVPSGGDVAVTGTLNVSAGIEVTSAEADTVTATGGGAVTAGSVSQSARKGVVTIDLATNSCNIANSSTYTLVVGNASCDADSVVAATVTAGNVTHSTSSLSGSGFRLHISNNTGSAITSNFTVNYIIL